MLLKKFFLFLPLLGLISCAHQMPSNINLVEVHATAETTPVNSNGDAADDPAIWYNAANPINSKIIGTQKKGGIYVYNLDGTIAQEIIGGKPNNADLRKDFSFTDGKDVIVGASDRIDNSIVLWRFIQKDAYLIPNPIARIKTDFTEVYGFCLGQIGDDFYAVATSKVGDIKAFKIKAGDSGIISEKVFEKSLGSIAEGCVIDDKTGHLYVSQELVGLWDINLKDNSTNLVEKIGNGRLVADVEGVSIWDDGKHRYLVVSVQGDSRFNIYDINQQHQYIGSFRVVASEKIDGVTTTDGIDISAHNFGPNYPEGLVVVQDDINTMPDATQNFKLVSWREIKEKLGLKP